MKTAAEMRAKAEKASRNFKQHERQKVFNMISESVESVAGQGEYQITRRIPGYKWNDEKELVDHLVSSFRDLGYQVSLTFGDYGQVEYIQISWKNEP